MVITLTVPLRKIFKLEAYLTVRHFDAMAKLILLTSLIVLYAYLSEFFMAWYSGEEIERSMFWNRLFGDYWWATWTMLVCNGLDARHALVQAGPALHSRPFRHLPLHQHRDVVRDGSSSS